MDFEEPLKDYVRAVQSIKVGLVFVFLHYLVSKLYNLIKILFVNFPLLNNYSDI